jgi:integrase
MVITNHGTVLQIRTVSRLWCWLERLRPDKPATAGICHGEIRALRANNIDLAFKRIKVRAGWDQYEGQIDPKTEKGRRTAVIIELLETLLIEHLERTGRSGTTSYSGETQTLCSTRTPSTTAPAAPGRSPANERTKRASSPSTNASGRSVFTTADTNAVSHMLDAGVTIDKVSKFIGHS